MKVICIDDRDFKRELTVGKVYEVDEITDIKSLKNQYYYVRITDNGREKICYQKSRFKEYIQDHREEILNQIL